MTLFLITVAAGFVFCAIARAARTPPERNDAGERLHQLRLI
jgi:hypothetical protein